MHCLFLYVNNAEDPKDYDEDDYKNREAKFQ